VTGISHVSWTEPSNGRAILFLSFLSLRLPGGSGVSVSWAEPDGAATGSRYGDGIDRSWDPTLERAKTEKSEDPKINRTGRVYRIGPKYRVVVEGLLAFEVDRLEGVEETTAQAILVRIRMAYPTRATPWADPSAERVMEFEVGVHLTTPALSIRPGTPRLSLSK
jgi:hypothetical protein